MARWDLIKEDAEKKHIGDCYIGATIVEELKNGQKMTYVIVDIDDADSKLVFVNADDYSGPPSLIANNLNNPPGTFNRDMIEYILSILPDDMVAAITPRKYRLIDLEGPQPFVWEEFKLWPLDPEEKKRVTDVLADNDIPHPEIFNYIGQYGFFIRKQK